MKFTSFHRIFVQNRKDFLVIKRWKLFLTGKTERKSFELICTVHVFIKQLACLMSG